MDLNAARMFVAVVQAGSLSAAATRLGIPLPTLSRRIRDLERQLKVQLLERSTRGAKLTDAGSRLYEHASRSIEALLEAEQAVVSDQAHLKGRLRLSLPQTFEPWWELLAAFQRRYPDIQVYVYSSNRRVDLIEDGIDVALRVGAIVHETMVARRVLSFRNILVASPALVKRFGLPDEPDALRRFPCAVWASRIDVPARWELGGHVIEPKAVLATNDYHHLCSRALDWRRGHGAPAISGGRAHSGEAPPAPAATASVAGVAAPSDLSAPPSPIHDCQDISRLLPELSPENRSGLRSLT